MKHLFFSTLLAFSLSSFAQNIGIGTLTPTTKLEVIGKTKTDTLHVTGNIGIGTAIPQHRLTVGNPPADNQLVSIRAYNNDEPNWKGGAAFGYATSTVIMGELGNVATIGGHNSNLSAWTDLAINPGGGNVGIGTSTPSQKLEVVGTIKATNLLITTGLLIPSGAAAGKILQSDASGNASWVIPAVSSNIYTADGTLTGNRTVAMGVNNLSFTGTGKAGFGTATPDPSSKVEISSTTQGFLPPRMTFLQRGAIGTPAQGLMIYCTDCGVGGGEPEYYNGNAWVNMIGGTAAVVLVIGDFYQGGKVAYILQPGDPGYIAGPLHGLIAAALDQSTGMEWATSPFITTNATAVLLGTGNANTNTIVAAQGAGSYAAKLCYDLVLNGYSDWYLPSKDELNKLYLNRIAVGGFTNNFYWSSSELDNSSARDQFFNGGGQAYSPKDTPINVRAVRAF